MKQTIAFYRSRVLGALLLTLIALPLQARIRLPHILSDGMVIQQLSDFAFWGWAKPNTQITVEPSWKPDKLVVNSDAGASLCVHQAVVLSHIASLSATGNQ